MPRDRTRVEPSARRRFLGACLGLGGAGLFALASETGLRFRPETLAAAEELAGLSFTEAERALMLAGLGELEEAYSALRDVPLPNAVPPALDFDPRAGRAPKPGPTGLVFTSEDSSHQGGLGFASAVALGRKVRDGEISSVELTEHYLARLERHDPTLHCVIHAMRERALREAMERDRERARGEWRGPLHGVPYGAKDLLAARGAPTTWGAEPYREQVFTEDASVVRRLEQAGAVLVAKLSLGALAWGDVWYGETTRNPWNPEQGSSGSSAGPASATSAGLVGFSIGSETWGSIVSPSTRCGVTGLRPTFGRVGRGGAMALSWSMDKLGPMCRDIEDCAAVFAAIHGRDEDDPASVDAPFSFAPRPRLDGVRLGVIESAFEDEGENGEDAAWRGLDRRVLTVLRELGAELVPFELPALPIAAMSFILNVEAAAAFDELTRSGRDDALVRQIEQAWPNVFRQSRMIPAVEYVQANRVRTLALRELERGLAELDGYVCPSFVGDNLLVTNLTGHPSVVLPNGFLENGAPASITFVGRLDGDGPLLEIAGAYQRATPHHLVHPKEYEDERRT